MTIKEGQQGNTPPGRHVFLEEAEFDVNEDGRVNVNFGGSLKSGAPHSPDGKLEHLEAQKRVRRALSARAVLHASQTAVVVMRSCS